MKELDLVSSDAACSQSIAEGDSFGARHQHTKRDGLRIAIGETLVGCVGKE